MRWFDTVSFAGRAANIGQLWAAATLLAVLASGVARADEPLEYVSVPLKSRVEISGSSTLHDWKASGDTIKGLLVFWEYHRAAVLAADQDFPLEDGQPVSLDFWIPVATIQSDSDGLNEQIWKQLNSRENPIIKFGYKSAKFISHTPPDKFVFDVQGTLTVNGVNRPSQLQVTVIHPVKQEFTIATETRLKMSDFEITPPTFMGGLLKADDEVRVKVKWVVGLYKKQAPDNAELSKK